MAQEIRWTQEEKNIVTEVTQTLSLLSRLQRRAFATTLLLEAMDEDITRPGIVETPTRVARMHDELFRGYQENPATILGVEFDEDCKDMVVVRDIPFYSHCEHHLVPFFGVVHIAYIPNGKVTGLSKFARLVECYARRIQIQERLTAQIADAIEQYLKPLGVAVVIRAEHMCMTMRGVQKPGTSTVTSALRGLMKFDDKARTEFLRLAGVD